MFDKSDNEGGQLINCHSIFVTKIFSPSNNPTQVYTPNVFLVILVVFPQLAYSFALCTEEY